MNNFYLLLICATLYAGSVYTGYRYGRSEMQRKYAQAALERQRKLSKYEMQTSDNLSKANGEVDNDTGTDFDIVFNAVDRLHKASGN